MLNNREAPRTPKELFVVNGQFGDRETTRKSENQSKVLPLGAFSNYVLSEQPQLLTEVRNGTLDPNAVAQRQKKLLASVQQSDIGKVINNPDMAKIAMLDLSFAMSALIFSGVTPPHEVQQLNTYLAGITGLPEMMTFEKVVSINSRLPFNQMRVFTEGAVGDSERRFYYGHDLMDVKMKDTVSVATQSIDLLKEKGNGGADETVMLLNKGVGNMEEFAEFMRSFNKMPREHFGEFRQYLSQYSDGTRNASGAFIGMPRLDIRLSGLSPRYEQFLDEAMEYFPIKDQLDIQQARDDALQGYCLVSLCEKLQGDAQKKVAKALIDVIDPIMNFRLRHLAAVNHFVPQVLPEGLKNLKAELSATDEEEIFDNNSSTEKGTAGFLPGPLLRNMIRLDLKAMGRLNGLLEKEEK